LWGAAVVCPLTAAAQSPGVRLSLPAGHFSRSTAASGAPLSAMHSGPASLPARIASFAPHRFGRISLDDAPPRTQPLIPHMNQTDTLFMSRTSFPVAQFAGSHFQLSGFGSTVHMSDVEFGPSAGGGLLDFRPPRQYGLDTPHTIDAYGLSLSFRLGRGASMDVPRSDVFKTLGKIFRGQF
jgi:hypothetical protein